MTMKNDKMDELLYSISQEERIPNEMLVNRTLNRIKYSTQEKRDNSRLMIGAALILFTLLNCLLPISLLPLLKHVSFKSLNIILLLAISFTFSLNSIFALIIVYFRKSNTQEG